MDINETYKKNKNNWILLIGVVHALAKYDVMVFLKMNYGQMWPPFISPTHFSL